MQLRNRTKRIYVREPVHGSNTMEEMEAKAPEVKRPKLDEETIRSTLFTETTKIIIRLKTNFKTNTKRATRKIDKKN